MRIWARQAPAQVTTLGPSSRRLPMLQARFPCTSVPFLKRPTGDLLYSDEGTGCLYRFRRTQKAVAVCTQGH